ncbi:MAG: glutamine-hydrolyzing GMP synthase, partial [Candidatus Zixiibacteriota bacterium]
MILILDFGSQYTQLIARRVREAHVYCEIVPCTTDLHGFDDRNVRGVILSGGPQSLSDPGSPRLPPEFFERTEPVLGICYGIQLIAEHFGGALAPADTREYGEAHLTVVSDCDLFSGIPKRSRIWMSHGDSVVKVPPGFEVIGSTDSLPVAAIADHEAKTYGVQFHPEVHHTDEGRRILHNFLFDICGVTGDWTTEAFVESAVAAIRQQVGDGKVLHGI